MKKGFLISAALAFFLMVLVGYVKDHSLLTTVGRALVLYVLILALGAISETAGLAGSFPETRPAEVDAQAKQDGSDSEVGRINREVAQDPGKVARTIKKMIK